MKKYILMLLCLFLSTTFSYADTVEKYFDYGVDSEVNYLRLNGNIDNIIRIANGGWTNVNAKTGFRFVEILSVLPVAGTEGRIVFRTTDDTLTIDNGTEFAFSPTYLGDAIQGDVLYFNGTIWARLAAGTVGNTLKTNGSGDDPSWTALNLEGGAGYVSNQLPLDNGGTGQDLSTNNQGDVYYDGGTNGFTRLTPGTSGEFLKTQGATANPIWALGINASQYYEPDSTCIVAFDNGSLALDLSTLHNAISLTSLAEADLVDGIVSAKCYDYKGTEADYATIATSALQAGMSNLTLEVWVYRDTAGNTDSIIYTDDDLYIVLEMTDSNIIFNLITSGTNATSSFAHGLSDNGINQEVHIVGAWETASSMDIYVNGSDIGDGTAGNGTVSDSTNGINIGVDQAEGDAFHGRIDGVRILRRTMDAAEVLSRYDAFK